MESNGLIDKQKRYDLVTTNLEKLTQRIDPRSIFNLHDMIPKDLVGILPSIPPANRMNNKHTFFYVPLYRNCSNLVLPVVGNEVSSWVRLVCVGVKDSSLELVVRLPKLLGMEVGV